MEVLLEANGPAVAGWAMWQDLLSIRAAAKNSNA
jgi:hypothetical protein